jgi:hypothetical protein
MYATSAIGAVNAMNCVWLLPSGLSPSGLTYLKSTLWSTLLLQGLACSSCRQGVDICLFEDITFEQSSGLII